MAGRRVSRDSTGTPAWPRPGAVGRCHVSARPLRSMPPGSPGSPADLQSRPERALRMPGTARTCRTPTLEGRHARAPPRWRFPESRRHPLSHSRRPRRRRRGSGAWCAHSPGEAAGTSGNSSGGRRRVSTRLPPSKRPSRHGCRQIRRRQSPIRTPDYPWDGRSQPRPVSSEKAGIAQLLDPAV